MLYKVSFLIHSPDTETEEDFKEWVRCEVLQEPIPESNPLEFAVFEDKIMDLKIEKRRTL